MRKITSIFVLLFITINGFSQTEKRCASTEAMDIIFKKHLDLKQKFDAHQKLFNQKLNKSNNYNTLSATPNYTIPIVFHILHLGGNEDISDSQVIDQVRVLNLDYSKKNADTSLTLSVFKPIADSTSIRFALAKKDPNGNCTNGIVHYYSADANWKDNSPTLYAQGWDPTKYLNVYVVKSITLSSGFNAAGYTYLPGTYAYGAPEDAIVVLNDYIGTIGTSSSFHSHVLTHEVGHWFNLLHVFGWNSCAVDCNNDDFVFDTPQTPGYLSCPTSVFSQNCTPGVIENYQNFMDYSYCETMFTHEQALRMDAAAHDNTVGRDNLWTNSNLIFTGIIGTYSCTPVADFKVNKMMLCSGQTLTYIDNSHVGTSGSIAWTFQGGTPATSIASSVAVTYTTIGTYSVNLTASNASGTNTKILYVTVTNGGGGIVSPYAQNFEGAGVPSDIAVINGNAGSVAWLQNTATGGNTTAKSIYLNNASASTGGNLDIFETSIFDFHNTTNVSLSYWYAYAKKTATQVDTFKVQYSLDCGGSWSNVIGIPSITTMATNTGGTTSTAFVPTSTQWKQANVSSALLATLSNKPSVKFRFYFRSDATLGSSNNIYIDEINLAGTVGLNELENMIGLTIYPNPTNASAVVNFITPGNETSKISVLDIVGSVVEESTTPTINGKNVSYTVNKNGALAKGIYIVNIDVNNQRISKKLIVE